MNLIQDLHVMVHVYMLLRYQYSHSTVQKMAHGIMSQNEWENCQLAFNSDWISNNVVFETLQSSNFHQSQKDFIFLRNDSAFCSTLLRNGTFPSFYNWYHLAKRPQKQWLNIATNVCKYKIGKILALLKDMRKSMQFRCIIFSKEFQNNDAIWSLLK